MIKGKRIETISFFDVEHFPGWEREKVTDLTHYFTRYPAHNPGPEEENTFDSDLYLDLLAAPWFVHQKNFAPSFIYPQELVDYFFSLFPKADTYKALVEQYLPQMIHYIESFEYHQLDIKKIIAAYGELQIHLGEIQQKYHLDKGSNWTCQKYARVTVDQLIKKVRNLSGELELTPMDVIAHRYYNRSGLSWRENPLGFFIHLLYNKGFKNLENSYAYDMKRFGDIDDFPSFLHQKYNNEYRRSYNLLHNDIQKCRGKERQRYIDTLCSQLNVLYDKAFEHTLEKKYQNSTAPIKLLVRDLKSKFKTSAFPVSFDYQNESSLDLPIQEPAFLKKLHAFTIPTIEGEELKLFSDVIKPTQIGLFINGQFEDLPSKVILNWPPGETYYLLIRLKQEQAPFELRERDVEKIIKQFVFKNGDVCCRDNLYRHRRDLKRKLAIGLRPDFADHIDTLFM